MQNKSVNNVRHSAILVVGSGVSGLSCGIRLREAGFPTEIWTKEAALETVSAVAAAFWYPYQVYPEDLVLDWARITYEELNYLASIPDTGVSTQEMLEIFPFSATDPWWHSIVPQLRRSTSSELPAGYTDGYTFPLPLAEMPIYLTYLTERFTKQGGHIRNRTVKSLDDIPDHYSVIVNCSGLGARTLVSDKTVYPIRGQVLRVSNPGLKRLIFDQHGPAGLAYIVPRSRDCILGGTSEEGNFDEVADSKTVEEIFARCLNLEPRLANATVLDHNVGLRPGRPTLRVEAERKSDNRLVVHNYGHGGAGIALSWGCAQEVVNLVTQYRGSDSTEHLEQ